MRLTYNAPVVLTFVIISVVFLGIDAVTGGTWNTNWIASSGRFDLLSLSSWTSGVMNIFGHGSYAHLAGNMTFMLLLGPMLEERYGSGRLLAMIVVTALVTSFANALFWDGSIIGASGIVFMLIMLASFTSMRKGEFPITGLLALLFYIPKEVLGALEPDQISHFAHIAGGCAGAGFGFLFSQSPRAT